MMQRYIREARLLAADDPADIDFSSTRFDYIYQVGVGGDVDVGVWVPGREPCACVWK